MADPVWLDLNTVHWLAVSVRPVSHLNRGDWQSYQPPTYNIKRRRVKLLQQTNSATVGVKYNYENNS